LEYQILSEEFIEKYKDKIDWGVLMYQELFEKFMAKYENKVDWKNVL
jgi:hypothetical protein